MLIQNVKKKAQLEQILGKTLMNAVLNSMVEKNWRRMPTSITLVAEKPKFYLDDSSGLHAYVVNLETGTILANTYCGSGSSAINYQAEQFSEGGNCPDNHAVVFVERYYAGNKSGWTLTIVSNNFTKQVDGMSQV